MRHIGQNENYATTVATALVQTLISPYPTEKQNYSGLFYPRLANGRKNRWIGIRKEESCVALPKAQLDEFYGYETNITRF